VLAPCILTRAPATADEDLRQGICYQEALGTQRHFGQAVNLLYDPQQLLIDQPFPQMQAVGFRR
jgi:hypothetical protein